jgi:hypothetical protein
MCWVACCFYLIVDITSLNILALFNEKSNKITQLMFKGSSDVSCERTAQTWQDKLWSEVELITKM